MTTAETGIIRTERMDLLLAHGDILRALIEGRFEEEFGFRVVENYLEFPGTLEAALKAISENPADIEWWAPRLFVHRGDRAVIGLGGYKGPPAVEEMVEIGYGVAPDYRGQGYATEAARAMVRHAIARPGVSFVRAHTLPEVNASNAILAHLGFHRVADIVDPEDGPVWRWEYRP